MATIFSNPDNISAGMVGLLLRLSAQQPYFLLHEVCEHESPRCIGRFQFYKQFCYLQLHGYIQPVASIEPDSYNLTPLGWDYINSSSAAVR